MKKSKKENIEDLEFAVEELFGQITTKQYKELWKLLEEIKLDQAIEEEEKCKLLDQ